jgi:hypothetical protein
LTFSNSNKSLVSSSDESVALSKMLNLVGALRKSEKFEWMNSTAKKVREKKLMS